MLGMLGLFDSSGLRSLSGFRVEAVWVLEVGLSNLVVLFVLCWACHVEAFPGLWS